MPECAHCGSEVPAGSRFCLQCGRPLAAAPPPGEARRLRVPGRLRAREPLAIVALALAVGGIVLLAGRVWAWGVVALLAAAVFLLLPGRVDRRTVNDVRFRVSALRESATARGRGQVGVFRARRDLAELEADRARLYFELGRAVYEDDETGRQAVRTALDAVLERIRAKEDEIVTLIRETEERVRRVQGPVQPTQVLRDEAPPEPPRIPEPWPPPDEGDIPEPPQPGPGGPTHEPAPPLQPPAPGSARRRA